VEIPGLAGVPPGYVPVSFHVFLPPADKMPAGGFPVVIYGHGLGDTQFGAPTYMASTLAANGIATLALEIPGHGYGPGGAVSLGLAAGGTATVATPGRGVALSPGAPIGPTDGCILPGPLAIRDCARQSAVDLLALVRTIRETGGLGMGINGSRIYYVGQSFGSVYGSIFHAVEPFTKAAVMNVNGASSVMTSRLSPVARQLGSFYLQTYNPPLLNMPPAPPEPYTDWQGVTQTFPDNFNDNYVYRDSAPVVNNVEGAIPIQVAFDTAEWLEMFADPLAYAPHFKNAPLASVPAKSTLVQFAFGDLEMPNPTNSAFIRAGGLQSTSWYYRFDIAAIMHPELLFITQGPLPIMPHRFLSNPTIFKNAAENSVAMAAQQQVAAYFASDGNANPDPNALLQGVFAGVPLFEIPAALPERLNYIQPLRPPQP